MPYLKLTNLSPLTNDNDSLAYLGWPVKAIPVRFWELSPDSLDALEEAILGLSSIGISNEQELFKLLGIPFHMIEMVKRTVRSLRSKGLLDENALVTKNGLEALQTHQLHEKYFQQGWVFLDQVRNFIFPFVFIGELRFYSKNDIDAMNHEDITDRVPDNNEDIIRAEIEAAIAEYNRRKAILELLADDANQIGNELERDYDLPLKYSDGIEIEDVDPLLSFSEEHYLVIPISASSVPGKMKIVFHSFSPFSMWEQDAYLNWLKRANNYANNTSRLLTKLEKEIKTTTDRNLSSDFETKIIGQTIENNLKGTVIPNELLDQLWVCEFNYLEAIKVKQQYTASDRRSSISLWGSLLEETMSNIASESDRLLTPNEWRLSIKQKHGESLVWYNDLISSLSMPTSWVEIPKGIKANLKTQLNKLPTSYKDMSCKSSRDYAVKVMLCFLAHPSETGIGTIRNFANDISNAGSILERIDFIVDWRNDSSHRGQRLNQLSENDYRNVLEKVKENYYYLLQRVYPNTK